MEGSIEIDTVDVSSKVIQDAGNSEFDKEMSFLKQRCPLTGSSLYDHLCDIVQYVLANKRQNNKLTYFEECSRMLRERNRVYLEYPLVKEKHDTCREHALKIKRVLKDHEARRPLRTDEEDLTYDSSDILETLHFLRRAGIAIPDEEAITIGITMRELVSSRTLTKLRFWGKVMGRRRDYWVLEAELTDDELDRRLDLSAREQQDELEDPLNRKVYLVCNEAGEKWCELPCIHPRQVQAARKQLGAQLFSGDLDTKVPGYPGLESHLLHAQLVRISSSCTVSPLGVYARSPAARQDLDEDECGVVLNADWLGVPASVSMADLVEPSLASWAHHVPYLLLSGHLADHRLEDGRDTQDEEEEEEEEEVEEEELLVEDEDSLQEEEEEGEVKEEEAARAPWVEEEAVPLLTPLCRDEALRGPPGQPAWSARLCSGLLPQTSTALLRSNRWPGAVAFCCGRKFGNVYFGWGSKAAEVPLQFGNRPSDSHKPTYI